MAFTSRRFTPRKTPEPSDYARLAEQVRGMVRDDDPDGYRLAAIAMTIDQIAKKLPARDHRVPPGTITMFREPGDEARAEVQRHARAFLAVLRHHASDMPAAVGVAADAAVTALLAGLASAGNGSAA